MDQTSAALLTDLGAFAAFVWGALWGSFANVVIWRLPHGESLVSPGSRCPACKSPIRPWHNLPVLGWLLLRGRCADCGVAISARYPVVELVTGALAAALWYRLAGPHLPTTAALFAGQFMLVWVLVVLSYIDLDYRMLPHKLTLPFLLLGVVLTSTTGPLRGMDWRDSAFGIALGGGIIWLVIQVYYWVRKREGMGGGDFVLMALLGAWLGYRSILWLFFASALQGTLFACGLWLTRRRLADPLPWPLDSEELPPELAAALPASAALAPQLPEHVSPDGSRERDEAESAAPDMSFGAMEIPFGPFLALSALQWVFFEPWIVKTLYGIYGLD
jgi:leader peptidase (prepilin peptidase)/N-methyltransferase